MKTPRHFDSIIFSNGMENTVELRNSVGELIMLQRTSASKISLDLSGVPAGIYNISVYSERGPVQTKRWIKIK